MYLTLTLVAGPDSDSRPATDLGYLLHKHPDRVQRFEVAAGSAYVFYPQADAQRCTAALLLEVDPIALTRGHRGGAGNSGAAGWVGHYVNDRPYAASSLLAVALGKVFRTALSGRCDARPELAARPVPLEIHLPAVPTEGGPELVGALLRPLGWTVTASGVPLDETVPGWGLSRYVDVRLSGTVRLAEALSHLYVLLPVLDDAKHYWVSSDEVDKLVRAGSGWLATHPERELITRRYLAHQRGLVRDATSRLEHLDGLTSDDLPPPAPPAQPLAALRRRVVLEELRAAGARRVLDLGCGEGALLSDLIADPRFTEVVGADVSPQALQQVERRLRLDRMPNGQRARLRLLQSSLTYRDRRLAGYDAAVLTEVVEHLDLERLPALEHTVFGQARPGTVLVTTPNAEHNVRYHNLAPGAFRHRDHRFEWTRAELRTWAEAVAKRTGYAVRFGGIGEDDPAVGPPTQFAVFTRLDDEASQEAS